MNAFPTLLLSSPCSGKAHQSPSFSIPAICFKCSDIVRCVRYCKNLPKYGCSMQRWQFVDNRQSRHGQHSIAGVVIHRENNSAVFAFEVGAHPSKFVASKCPQICPCSPTLSTPCHQGRLGGSCRNYSDFGSSRTRGDPFSPLESIWYHQISSWDRKCKLRTFFLYYVRDQLEYQAQRLFSMELWGHFPRGIRASRNVQWAWLVLPAKQCHSTNATRHQNVTSKLESFCERKW
jgi:hypothetical protein